MKKLFTLILIGLLLSSCSNDDEEGIDCALFDPAFPSLYVRLVDDSGTNLIENGTIDPDDISVDGDFPGAGFQFVPANEYANPDAEITAFDNSLHLNIPQQPTFHYNINLGDLETIAIDFEGEFTEIPCDLSYYIPIEAQFNGEKLDVREISSLQYLVVITL